jgi:hypothetical protein
MNNESTRSDQGSSAAGACMGKSPFHLDGIGDALIRIYDCLILIKDGGGSEISEQALREIYCLGVRINHAAAGGAAGVTPNNKLED